MDYGLGSGILKLLLTRFVLGILSLTQLVYMSEIGILILRSSVPVNYIGFVVIFIQRGDYAADYCVDCAFVCVLNSGEWKKQPERLLFSCLGGGEITPHLRPRWYKFIEKSIKLGRCFSLSVKK